MEVVKSSAGVVRQCREWDRHGLTIGFVPTMGALHEGHLALVARARKECHQVVLSIYVNPAQFGPKEDLARYPRPRRKDLAICREAGVDLVFTPENLYGPGHSTWVEETVLSQGQEGTQRPGHFRGVATVVLILFNIVQPSRAYFGQKDAQQVQVVVVPTVRDKDGLALSSRNRYLGKAERILAVRFAELLRQAAEKKEPEKWLIAELARVEGITLDYCECTGGRLVAAVRIGKTRLLDNRAISR